MNVFKITNLFRQFSVGIALGAALIIPLGINAQAQSAVEEWVQRYNGLEDLDAYARKVVLDQFGNVIVAGYNFQSREDWFVIKYSGAGVALWTNYCSQPATVNNGKFAAVGVGGNGNVYVTGWTGGTNYDYVTIAYTSEGVPLWTNRYNGLGNSTDAAVALAAAPNGDVFVAGYSSNNGVGNYVIIAYASSGVPLWTNRFDGSENSYEYSAALTLDGAGNVLVAGMSAGVGGAGDYLTIKYSNTGLPLWTNRYGFANVRDEPRGLVASSNGTVYVTGMSERATSGIDYATIAYSSNGLPLWTNFYNGPGNGFDYPRGLAVDANGKLFVTGFSAGGGGYTDYATIAYSSGGVPLWTNRYNGPGNGNDEVSGIAVDAAGSVFVTGAAIESGMTNDYVTIKYSNSGVPLWMNRYDGPGNNSDFANALAVDASGKVVVVGDSIGAGSSGFDAATIAYSNAGTPLWTNRYVGLQDGVCTLTDMVSDGLGNIVVTGMSTGPGSSQDFLTIKYSSAGAALWTNRHNGLGNGPDQAWAIAADGVGNVYVTGNSASKSGFPFAYDYLTVAYWSNGLPKGGGQYSGAGNNDDYANAIAVSGNGNVIVTGHSFAVGTGHDFATVTYSSAWSTLAVNRHNGSGNAADSANAIAVDGNGDVIVVGYVVGSGAGVSDYATIKYSSAGAHLWTQYYNGPGNSYDQAYSVAVDSSNNVFVAGFSYGAGFTRDYAILKYSPTGAPLWTNRYSGPGASDDVANDLAVDGAGSVYVTGSSTGSGSSNDFVTIKYSVSGLPLWTNRYNGPGNGADSANALAVDVAGTVIVTGTSNGGASGNDFATIAYSSSGVPLWTNRFNGSTNDSSAAIAVDGDGSVFVAGGSRAGSGYGYVTVKYAVSPVIVTQPTNQVTSWGSNATFSVASLGTRPLAYQWFFNGHPIEGATNSAFIVQSAAFADQGEYHVVVSNFVGSAISSAASLSVSIEPPLAIDTSDGRMGFTNGLFGFSLNGPAGLNALIQASSDLQHWVTIQTNIISDGLLYVSDPESQTLPIRFYRAVLMLP